MQRGNLVVYDETGKIFYQTGEAEGDVLPNVVPVGLPYIEIPFGTMVTKMLKSIDVTGEVHVPIFEDVATTKTMPEMIDEAVEDAIDAYTLSLIEGGLL